MIEELNEFISLNIYIEDLNLEYVYNLKSFNIDENYDISNTPDIINTEVNLEEINLQVDVDFGYTKDALYMKDILDWPTGITSQKLDDIIEDINNIKEKLPLNVTNIKNDDILVFNNNNWENKQYMTIIDGGNF